MIPDYLKGKTAAQIIGEVGAKFIEQKGFDEKDYILYLENMLLLAVKDALMNADATGKLHKDRAEQAEGLAIAFLNMVLPHA